MLRIALTIACLFSLITAETACSGAPDTQKPSPAALTKESPAASLAADTDLARIFGRAWRISKASSAPASGTIYVFLANGTLLETSCVETYRIASWTIDDKQPGVLRVVEDQRPAFMAKIVEVTDKTLRLQQTLLMGSKETRELALESIDQEFVCPDLPK